MITFIWKVIDDLFTVVVNSAINANTVDDLRCLKRRILEYICFGLVFEILA